MLIQQVDSIPEEPGDFRFRMGDVFYDGETVKPLAVPADEQVTDG